MVDYNVGQYVYFSDGQKLGNIERRLLVATYCVNHRFKAIPKKVLDALLKQYDDMRWEYVDEINNTEMGYALRDFDGTEKSAVIALERLTQNDFSVIAKIAKTVEAGYREEKRELRKQND